VGGGGVEGVGSDGAEAEIVNVALDFVPAISVPLPSAARIEAAEKETTALPSRAALKVTERSVFFPDSAVVFPPSKEIVPLALSKDGSTAQRENAELFFDTPVTVRREGSNVRVAFPELNPSGESAVTETVKDFPTPYVPVPGEIARLATPSALARNGRARKRGIRVTRKLPLRRRAGGRRRVGIQMSEEGVDMSK